MHKLPHNLPHKLAQIAQARCSHCVPYVIGQCVQRVRVRGRHRVRARARERAAMLHPCRASLCRQPQEAPTACQAPGALPYPRPGLGTASARPGSTRAGGSQLS